MRRTLRGLDEIGVRHLRVQDGAVGLHHGRQLAGAVLGRREVHLVLSHQGVPRRIPVHDRQSSQLAVLVDRRDRTPVSDARYGQLGHPSQGARIVERLGERRAGVDQEPRALLDLLAVALARQVTRPSTAPAPSCNGS